MTHKDCRRENPPCRDDYVRRDGYYCAARTVEEQQQCCWYKKRGLGNQCAYDWNWEGGTCHFREETE